MTAADVAGVDSADLLRNRESQSEAKRAEKAAKHGAALLNTHGDPATRVHVRRGEQAGAPSQQPGAQACLCRAAHKRSKSAFLNSYNNSLLSQMPQLDHVGQGQGRTGTGAGHWAGAGAGQARQAHAQAVCVMTAYI